jgi:hypothetical protein
MQVLAYQGTIQYDHLPDTHDDTFWATALALQVAEENKPPTSKNHITQKQTHTTHTTKYPRNITVVGMGYVSIPVEALFADADCLVPKFKVSLS